MYGSTAQRRVQRVEPACGIPLRRGDLGTTHLFTLNTSVVADITYAEALEQMVRPVIIRLNDSAGNTLAGIALNVTDDQGSALSWVDLGGGQYAVLLPNQTAVRTITVSAAGYQSLSVKVDADERLSILAVTLAKT